MPRTLRPLAFALTLAAALQAHAAPPAPACAGSTSRSDRPPGTADADRALATWLALRSPAELDTALLTADEIVALNARNASRVGTWQDVLTAPPRSPRELDAELLERFAHMRLPLETGAWIEARPGAFGRALALATSSRPASGFHLVLLPADLRCIPEPDGLFTRPPDPDFDRNRCSSLHAGELVRVDRVSADGRWRYVHAGHGVGWLEAPALTPPLSAAEAAAFRDAPHRLVPLDDAVPTAYGAVLDLGTAYPIVGHADGFYQIRVPTPLGLEDDFVADTAPVHDGPRPLPRRNLLTLLFRHLGDPYGWGGTGGGRDCSRLLLDTFSTFGVRFGRHSGVIGQSGVRTVELAGLSEREKRDAIRRADAEGVVLLYMPGHIMCYLGERDGAPHALSALSEYLVPCAGGGEHTVRLDRVDVTTLELGRGTSRTAYLERLTRLAVFAP